MQKAFFITEMKRWQKITQIQIEAIMEKVIAIEQTESDRDPNEVPKEYHVVIATIEGATEMILVEIEIGMTTDMIQDTMIEKNIEEMKIEIIIGNPIDREIVVDQGTVVNGDALIVVEIVAIHANTTDIVENEIEVLIKEGDSPLHQDIMIAMIAKIMGIEDTHLMKGKFLRFTCIWCRLTCIWCRFRYPSHNLFSREYRNDRNRHDHSGHNSGRSGPPPDSRYDQSHSQRPAPDRRSQDDPRWPNHAVNSRDTRWAQGSSHGMHHDGQNGRSHHDGRNHHEAQMDQTGYSPIPNNNRKFQEPPVYNPSPSNPPHPHQNNDISHGHGVGPGARRRQSEHTVHPHESSTIPQRTGAQPKPPSKQAIDQKRSAHFNQVQILRRLKMRKETVWSI